MPTTRIFVDTTMAKIGMAPPDPIQVKLKD